MNDDAELRSFLRALAESVPEAGALPDPGTIRMKAAARARLERWDAATKPMRVAEWTVAAVLAAAVVVFGSDLAHTAGVLNPLALAFMAVVLAGTAIGSGVLIRWLWAEE